MQEVNRARRFLYQDSIGEALEILTGGGGASADTEHPARLLVFYIIPRELLHSNC